jgi:Flp pilus assembly protein TadG
MYQRAISKLKEWLAAKDDKDPRRSPRYPQPEVLVHYWDGSAPEGRRIRDISQHGAYIYTPDRWYVGTIIRFILQYQPPAQDGCEAPPAVFTCIPARVVRHGPEGVAVDFAFSNQEDRQALQRFLDQLPAKPALPMPSRAMSHQNGQALVELALVIPLVFLLAVNAANFGGFLYAWITVAGAARSAGQYMIMSSASPGAPTAATLAQVTTLVTNDATSLLNRSSLVVAICTNKTAAANSCTALFDPEAPKYTLATVDVTYTYKPLIPLFSFPKLGIGATLPSTAIHRKAVVRMLQ